MAQAGSQFMVRAPSGSYFTATLAQNAGLNARIPLPEAIAAGRTARSLIRSIIITSFDQCDWETWFWRNSLFQTNDAREAFAGYWGFAVAGGDGKRIGGAGLYYYYIDGLAIPYIDEDAGSNISAGAFLNVTLVNRSAGAKTVSQWFDATFILEPTLSW